MGGKRVFQNQKKYQELNTLGEKEKKYLLSEIEKLISSEQNNLNQLNELNEKYINNLKEKEEFIESQKIIIGSLQSKQAIYQKGKLEYATQSNTEINQQNQSQKKDLASLDSSIAEYNEQLNKLVNFLLFETEKGSYFNRAT